MTDYTELVKALRGLANGIWKNSEYTWFGGEEKVFAEAAAAIEALQAQVKRLNMRCADCEYASKPWPELEPKLGEWVKGADGLYKCSVCGELECCRGKYCPDCGAKMEVQDGTE